MIIVEWNNTTHLNTAIDANKGTTEDVVFRLTEDFTGVWTTASWSGFSTAGLTFIIDLNGFNIKPSGAVALAKRSGYSDRGAALFSFNGSSVPTGTAFGDDTAGGFYMTNGDSAYNGNIIIENGDIDIVDFGLYTGANGYLVLNFIPSVGFSGTLTLRRLNIKMGGGEPMFDNQVGNSSSPNAFSKIEMYGCYVNGCGTTTCAGNSYTNLYTTPTYVEDCIFNTTSDVFSQILGLYGRRVYTTSGRLAGTEGGNLNNSDDFESIASSNSDTNMIRPPGLASIPFNETVFNSLSPASELFLVPIEGSLLETSVNQTSIISSGSNTVGLNGIRSTDSNRVIGPMGMPIIVDGPTGMTMVYNSSDITVSWIADTDPSITRTKIFLDEYDVGDFTNEIADVPIATTTTNIPYSSLYQGKVSYIKLKHS